MDPSKLESAYQKHQLLLDPYLHVKFFSEGYIELRGMNNITLRLAVRVKVSE